MLELLLRRKTVLTDEELFHQFMITQHKDRCAFLGLKPSRKKYYLQTKPLNAATIAWSSSMIAIVLNAAKATEEEREKVTLALKADIEFAQNRFNLHSLTVLNLKAVALENRVDPYEAATSLQAHDQIYARIFSDYFAFTNFFRSQEDRKVIISDGLEELERVNIRAKYLVFSAVIFELQEIWQVMAPRESAYNECRRVQRREMQYVEHRADKIYYVRN